jgi:hypothetical protein
MRILRISGVGRLVWAVPSLIVALPYFFVWNTATLMDSALWSAVLGLLILAVLDERPRWIVGLSVGAALARPESMLVVPFVLLYATWSHPCEWRAGARAYAPALVAFLGAIAALTVFRLGYFGYPLPNTYYAKFSTDFSYEMTNGIAYILTWAIRDIWPVPMLLLAAGSITQRDGRPAAVLSAGALVIIVATTVSGGDHFAGHRFVQPAVPLLLGLGTLRFSTLWEASGVRQRWTLLPVALCTLATLALVRWSGPPHADTMDKHFSVLEQGRKLGAALSERFPSNPLVGHVAVGGIGYAYAGPILDLEGLNWTAMAHSEVDRTGRFKDHEAFDESIFWQRPPSLLLPHQVSASHLDGSRFLCDDDGWWQVYLHFLPGLLIADRFYDRFGLAIVAEDSSGMPIIAFVDRSWRPAQDVEWLEWNHCRSGPSSIPDPSILR